MKSSFFGGDRAFEAGYGAGLLAQAGYDGFLIIDGNPEKNPLEAVEMVVHSERQMIVHLKRQRMIRDAHVTVGYVADEFFEYMQTTLRVSALTAALDTL